MDTKQIIFDLIGYHDTLVDLLNTLGIEHANEIINQ